MTACAFCAAPECPSQPHERIVLKPPPVCGCAEQAAPRAITLCAPHAAVLRFGLVLDLITAMGFSVIEKTLIA